MGCHFLLQGIFPTQGSNLGLPHCRQPLYHMTHQGSPSVHIYVFKNIFFLLLLQVLDKDCTSLTPSLVAQRIKRLPAMQETQVRSLGWEDPLEEDMATHSSTLAWKIPWTEEPGRLHEVTKSDMTERLHTFTHRIFLCTLMFNNH